MMETTLYSNNQTHEMDRSRTELKRKMTLDLESNTTSVIKRSRHLPGNNSLQTPIFTKTEVLTSPDFHKLNLASPELERLILNPTFTPTTQTFFPKNVTEAQEDYVKGFSEALAQLQNQNQLGNNNANTNNYGNQNYSSTNSINSEEESTDDDSNSMTSSSTSYTTNGYMRPPPDYGVIVKEEPQTVPENGSSGGQGQGPMSPIDMANQEKIKLERKRQRNRVAASKCRKRKLERISKLEDKVKQIKMENTELISVSNKLRESVNELKREVMRHVELGCQILVNSGGGF